jgi:PIN domain nuclease of toxin-antitoxin system
VIRPILLDTCAAIWTNEAPGWSAVAETAIIEADADGAGIYVSPITAWEIGLLVSKGRLSLTLAPKAWFQKLLGNGIRLAALSPDILMDSTALPGDLHRDPADRILAATARALDYRLMTRDRPLLAYAEQGHIRAIAC